MSKVKLITMPWGQPVQPSLLMGNIHSIVDKFYDVSSYSFHLEFVNFISEFDLNLRDYQAMIGNYGLGDFIFSIPPLKTVKEHYDNEYISYLTKNGIGKDIIETALKLRDIASIFLDNVLEELEIIDEASTTVIFCPMYRELTPSLALAKLIHSKFPKVSIFFLGEVLEGDIEKMLTQEFNFITNVLACDPEKNILDVLRGNKIAPVDLNVRRLDFLNIPNYDEYYQRLKENAFRDLIHYENWIPFETSRGCWWAEKSKCSFCALTKTNATFREKDINNSLQGIIELSNRYRVLKFQFFDWIISTSYFTTLFQNLIKLNLNYTIYLQSKVNLSKDKFPILKKMGAVVQFGVESLNSHTLNQISKGATAIQNIKALKWASEYDVRAEWNILYNLPGEGENDMQELFDLIPSLFHLWPPSFNRFRLQKLSPYFEEPQKHGILIKNPLNWYNYVFSFISKENIKNIAEEYDYELENTRKTERSSSYEDKVRSLIRDWNTNTKNVYRKLVYLKGENFIKIIDLRYASGRLEYNLNEMESYIYLLCDTEQTIKNIKTKFHNKFKYKIENNDVLTFLNRMVKNRLMYTEKNKYLSLAISST